MKTTIFKEKHEALGARMVSFAGFYMPIQFEGINMEHETVRSKLGVFDVSHMGEIWVEGPQALNLLLKVSSNDAAALSDGKVQYACFPNHQGGIVDDFLVYRFHQEKFLLVVNATNTEKDWQWLIDQNSGVGARLTNASDQVSQLAVQGPLALQAMQQLTGENLVDMPYYTFKELSFAGKEHVIISTTGYTGSGGCEVYFRNEDGLDIYDAVLQAGEGYGIKPIGLAARDTLRLEMGFCLYGNDINDTTSPIEAGLGWITKFTEGREFINKDSLWKQKNEGVQKKLVGFEMIDKGIPRQHYLLMDEKGNTIGEVTSGTMSPTLKKPIGMGYVNKEYAAKGSRFYVEIRGKSLLAEVVKMPFYKTG